MYRMLLCIAAEDTGSYFYRAFFKTDKSKTSITLSRRKILRPKFSNIITRLVAMYLQNFSDFHPVVAK